jgi:hypothetical protein
MLLLFPLPHLHRQVLSLRMQSRSPLPSLRPSWLLLKPSSLSRLHMTRSLSPSPLLLRPLRCLLSLSMWRRLALSPPLLLLRRTWMLLWQTRSLSPPLLPR